MRTPRLPHWSFGWSGSLLSLLLLLTPLALQAQEDGATADPAPAPEAETHRFIQVQPDTIHFTFIEFHHFEAIRDIKEQMYAIPGVTDFIPYLATKGLITYDLRYSGHAKLLMKALQDTMAERYELGMKEIGEKAWEITLRKL